MRYLRLCLFKVLVITLMGLFEQSVGGSTNATDPNVFAHSAQSAIDRNDIHALRVLLDNVPRPDIFRTGGGGLLLSLYRSFMRADETQLLELKNVLVQTVWKGADPLAVVEHTRLVSSTTTRQSAVAHILDEWNDLAHAAKTKERAEIHRRSAAFFDRLFGERCLDPNALITVILKSKTSQVMPIAHWSLIQSNSSEIFNYFLRLGFHPFAADEHGNTVPMMLAVNGDLDGLEKFRQRFGAKRTAEAFNQVNSDTPPMSVLHFALLSPLKGNMTVDEVEPLLEFLCASGADPDLPNGEPKLPLPLSTFANRNADRYPSRQEALRALGYYCDANLPRLKYNAKSYLAASCATELSRPSNYLN